MKAAIRTKFNLNKNLKSFSDALIFKTRDHAAQQGLSYLFLQYNVLERSRATLSRTFLNETSQYNYLFEDLVVVVLQIVEGV